MFFVGVVFFAVFFLLIIVPVVVGAVQFWIFYVKLLRKKHSESSAKVSAAPREGA
jgi:hypothetical protein